MNAPRYDWDEGRWDEDEGSGEVVFLYVALSLACVLVFTAVVLAAC